MSERENPADALPDLFLGLVSALKTTVPFERAGLALIDGATRVRVLEVSFDREAPLLERLADRSQFSSRLWPSTLAQEIVVRDASKELDPTAEEDRRLVEWGARAVLAVPLSIGGTPGGLLSFGNRTGAAFERSHVEAVGPMGELLAVAAEHERSRRLDQLRQQRRQKLELLLPTIAEALDIRQVFLTLSGVIQDIVPHDILTFGLISPDRGGVRVQAATHNGLLELPEYRFSNEDEALDANWKFLLAYDLTPIDEGSLRARITPRDAIEPVDVVVRPGPMWVRFIATAGVRSTLRVPIRAKDRPVGGVAFLSRTPYAYDEECAALASRIADHVALALAHQGLAEEERKIAQAEERAAQLTTRVETLSRELARYSEHRALGQSPKWTKALADATQVAPTDTTVLITGESGTGKEVLARYIHRGSPRAGKPFVAINCAALPEQLLESELFGYERGAFTGALSMRPGKLEQAAGGVLFLDEVGEMSPAVQAKFLRVLQEREFQRLGGSRTLRADVRVLAATNRDPRRAMETGAFREDLYYRLSVFEIHLPPLRERADDIPVLAQAFLEEIGESVGRPAAGLSEDAREQLLAHSWPGNVRELRNAIERAVILCQGGLVTREHLPMPVARSGAPAAEVALGAADLPAAGLRLEAVERELLVKALARADNNKSQAAKLLGITRGQLYSLLRRHGLTDARR